LNPIVNFNVFDNINSTRFQSLHEQVSEWSELMTGIMWTIINNEIKVTLEIWGWLKAYHRSNCTCVQFPRSQRGIAENVIPISFIWLVSGSWTLWKNILATDE
jgi:hypothetical protein